MNTQRLKHLAKNLLLLNLVVVVMYFCMGRLSVGLSVQDESVSSSILQPEGMALAIGLLFGSSIWPGVLIGQLVLALSQGLTTVPALTSATGHALQLCVGVGVLNLVGFNSALTRQRDYLLLMLVILAVLQPLSRLMGLVALSWFQPVSFSDVLNTLTYAWVNQLMGELVTASTFLALIDFWKHHKTLKQWSPLLLTMGVFVACLSWLFFGNMAREWELLQIFALASVALTLISIRFAVVGATLGSLILLTITLLALRFGAGPLQRMDGSEEVLLVINTFLLGTVLSCGLIGSLVREQGDKERRLTYLASRDYLTGLYNRRNFYNMAAHALARMRRDGEKLTLVWMDLDKFKSINDTFGHNVGDRVLIFLARVLQEHFREEDLIARMGGEEFALLLRGNFDSRAIGEKIRQFVADAQKGISDVPHFTVSMGITPFLPSDSDIDVAMKRADEGLYKAKHQGRDRFVIADPTGNTQATI